MDQIAESPYVVGCRKQEQFKVIDVILPSDWEIPSILFPEGCTVYVNDGTNPTTFLFFSETEQFSDIYYKLTEVATYNKEKEEKLILLSQLQVELQNKFDELPLSQFQQIRIVTVDGLKKEVPTEIKLSKKVLDGTVPRP